MGRIVEIIPEVRSATDNDVSGRYNYIPRRRVQNEDLRDNTGHDTLIIAEKEHAQRHKYTRKQTKQRVSI